MTKKILILIALSFVLLSCKQHFQKSETLLEKGHLYLTEEMLEQKLLVTQGEWEFYWDRFIPPMSDPVVEPEFITPPNSWGDPYPVYGYATYRLILHKPESLPAISLYIGNVYSSHRLYANGQLLRQVGQPSKDLEQAVPAIHFPQVFTIQSSSDKIEILVHVANNSYRRNGVKTLYIATPEVMKAFEEKDLIEKSFIIAVLLAMTLYHFILAIQRKEQPYVLFFAFFCLAVLFRAYYIDSYFVMRNFPQIPFALWDRMQRLGIYPLTGLFVSYISALYPKEQNRLILRVSQGASVFFSVTAFILPLPLVSGLAYKLFLPFILLALFYSFYVLVLALIRKREEAGIIITGFLIFFGTVIFDLLMDREIILINISYTQEEGVLAFIFFQAVAISRRLTRAFINEKKLRQLLEGVQSRLELTIEGAQVGVIEWNIEEDEWFVNSNFYQMLGYKGHSRSINRDNWMALVHPDERKDLEYHLEKLLQGQIQHYSAEYRLEHKRGHYLWVNLLGRIIKRNEKGEPQWFSGLQLDISDKKQNEEQLNKLVDQRTRELEDARLEAEAANRAKSSFLANMSHEIRTPINGVTGMAEMLLDSELSDEQKEYALVISRSSQALLSIINDILDFSKIESQKIELESHPFDLMVLGENIIQMFENRSEEKGLELLFSFDQTAPKEVWGDDGRIRQVLTNLIGNAVKFTNRGYVLLEIHWEKINSRMGRFQFKVNDSGIGISRENQTRIFDNFIQADVSTTRIYGGSGLGLTISRQLVELMGGSLELESEEGKGSQFYFSLEMELSSPKSKTPGIFPENQRDILIAGGSELLKGILKKDTTQWGGKPVLVDTALEVRNQLEKEKFSFLLLADHLPDMSARQLLEGLPHRESLKTIILISLEDMVYQKELLQAGVSQFIYKPLTPGRLIKAIQSSDEQASEIINTSDGRRKLSGHILIAEDNKFNQRVAAAMLEKLGCSYDIAENGYEVLDKLRTASGLDFDLVLMDCHMPLLDGYKATGLIRLLDGAISSIPVIALTANVLSSDRQKCLDSGMNDYIPKPINLRDLGDKIQQYLGGDISEGDFSPPESGVLLDRHRLLEMVGSEESLVEMLTLFVENATRLFTEIEEKTKEMDYQELKLLAHKLKGMSANAGAVPLSRKAGDLEVALSRKEDKEFIFGYIFELKRDWEDLKKELGSY